MCQVSGNTKTTSPKTQNTLHKIKGHTHYEVIVIFKSVRQNLNLCFPQSTGTYLHTYLCFFIFMISTVYISCFGKGGKLFYIIQLAMSI